MPVKIVSSEEARTHLRDVMDEVTTGEAEVVIERHGKPMVAVISYKEYQRIQREREKRRAKLAKSRAEIEAGNFMTWEQVEVDLDTEPEPMRPFTSGPYAAYWNQFIGILGDEEWERPSQDRLEQRESW